MKHFSVCVQEKEWNFIQQTLPRATIFPRLSCHNTFFKIASESLYHLPKYCDFFLSLSKLATYFLNCISITNFRHIRGCNEMSFSHFGLLFSGSQGCWNVKLKHEENNQLFEQNIFFTEQLRLGQQWKLWKVTPKTKIKPENVAHNGISEHLESQPDKLDCIIKGL